MKLIVSSNLLCFLFMAQGVARTDRFPAFTDYVVHEKFYDKPSTPRITGRRAHMFRTMLRLNAEKGPNFAGHYIIASWGCGSDCKSLAIVDARTGEVHFLPGMFYVLRVPFQAEGSLQFRADSRLLIVVGARNGETAERKYFFEWSHAHLKLIRSTKEFRRNPYPF